MQYSVVRNRGQHSMDAQIKGSDQGVGSSEEYRNKEIREQETGHFNFIAQYKRGLSTIAVKL